MSQLRGSLGALVSHADKDDASFPILSNHRACGKPFAGRIPALGRVDLFQIKLCDEIVLNRPTPENSHKQVTRTLKSENIACQRSEPPWHSPTQCGCHRHRAAGLIVGWHKLGRRLVTL